ncbi:hypothetical protein K8T06_10910, partial [bacterium]|nr:hypothetical protein [bacterium]
YISEVDSMIIRNCQISRNAAQGNHGDGGGLYLSDMFQSGTYVLIEQCEISNNSAENGGGLFRQGTSNVVIQNNVFAHNTATQGGGIICSSYGELIIGGFDGLGNTFSNNKAGAGSDLYCLRLPSSPINSKFNTFHGYHPSEYYVTPQAAFDLTHCVSLSVPITQDVYVSPTGDDTNSGLTQNLPFQTISHALSTVYGTITNPITIHLDQGIFSQSTTGEQFPLNLFSYLNLSGVTRESTVIDAEGTDRVFSGSYSIYSSLSQMTITGGSHQYGGGIYFGNGELELQDVLLAENAAHDGGGACIENSKLKISDCQFYLNTSEGSGAGISTSYCNCQITTTEFNENIAFEDGGAIYNNSTGESGTIIYHCLFRSNCGANGSGVYTVCEENRPFQMTGCNFTDNRANEGGALFVDCENLAVAEIAQCQFVENNSYWGGGLYLNCGRGSDVDILNCLFAHNEAKRKYNDFVPEAGAIYLAAEDHASVDFVNCTLVDNQQTRDGCAVRTYLEEDSSAQFTNCILWNNEPIEIQWDTGVEPTVTYCLVKSGYSGEGNISSDPQFADGDLGINYLRQDCNGSIPYSSCIDSGFGHATDYSYKSLDGSISLDQLTTRSDNIHDRGIVDIGYHYPTDGLNNLGMNLIMTDTSLESGDLFNLHYYLYNSGATNILVDVWILLYIYGDIWFYPTWVYMDDGVDYKQETNLLPNQFVHENVLSFEWPALSDHLTGLLFYGAAFNTGTFEYFGDFQTVEWEY